MGSHCGSSFTPKKFTAEATEDAFFCQCKQTKNPPYCDGSHKSITKDQVGAEVISVQSSTAQSNEAESTPEEPHVAYIHELAKNGLSKVGHHGEMDSMGVPGKDLPLWDDIQFITGQLAKKPLLDNVAVKSELVIGKNAKKPLKLAIPLFVSDMSFGALSEEAKLSLAKGAELAGTGICSGEGGMLPEEQESNSRYFYELASGKFGFDIEKFKKCRPFILKTDKVPRPEQVATYPVIR